MLGFPFLCQGKGRHLGPRGLVWGNSPQEHWSRSRGLLPGVAFPPLFTSERNQSMARLPRKKGTVSCTHLCPLRAALGPPPSSLPRVLWAIAGNPFAAQDPTSPHFGMFIYFPTSEKSSLFPGKIP